MTKPLNWRPAHRHGRQERASREQHPWPAVYQTDRASLSTIASKQAQSASRNRRRVVPMTLPAISILGDDQ